MGYKMKGPSLYKPKMADMKIQKKYDKKADDRPMSSPYQSNTSELEAKGKKVIISTPVSGSQQVKNLEKYKELGKNDPEYAKTLNLSKQREQSEKEDSGKA